MGRRRRSARPAAQSGRSSGSVPDSDRQAVAAAKRGHGGRPASPRTQLVIRAAGADAADPNPLPENAPPSWECFTTSASRWVAALRRLERTGLGRPSDPLPPADDLARTDADTCGVEDQ